MEYNAEKELYAVLAEVDFKQRVLMLGAAHAWLLLMHASSNHYQETPCNLACPTNVYSHHLANISVQASPILQICYLQLKRPSA